MLWNLLWVLVVLQVVLYSKSRSFWLPKPIPWWYILFYFSGFPALLYQIVWQRALFSIYGVNIESVTMVVTAFMLGLGLGSLFGGILSRKQTLPLLVVFGGVELCIGAWGAISLRVFHWAAMFTAGVPAFQTGLLAFLLVVIPTVLMGCTLPILVSYTVKVSGNVGTSVGALYAVNTLGSATACFCAGAFTMRYLGESGSVELAVAMNVAVGIVVLAWHFRTRSNRGQDVMPSENAPIARMEPAVAESQIHSRRADPVHFPLAMLVVAIAGFISLSYEIVWYRLFSFTTGGLAKSFAFLLGAYLAGIGIGSLTSEPLCKRLPSRRTHFSRVAGFVLAANALGFLVAPFLSNLVKYVSLYWTLLPIGLAAAFLGAIFPLVCHLAVPPDDRAGTRTSYLYMSNIAGATAGSYTVGFVWMDMFAIRQIAVLLALLGVTLGLLVISLARMRGMKLGGFLAAAAAMVIFILFGSPTLFGSIYEKLLLKTEYQPSARFAHVVETRSGVITVTRGGMVFGGGVYDGAYNVDLVHDVNGIQRPFALSYLHPAPKQVLMVGLSSGSWAQVVANHPQLEHLTIVEINPGYLRLIAQYPEVASLLRNPRVEIEIDDGRRWLVRNRDRKFDVIVMNTTLHWRSNASNLLSVDFLQMVRPHLNPGGVLFYNTTNSPQVQATGAQVFRYGLRVSTFLAVSDSPLDLDRRRWQEMLMRYSIDGRPVLNLGHREQHTRLEEVVSLQSTPGRANGGADIESMVHLRARTAHARIVTDDNMGTEWLPHFERGLPPKALAQY